MALPDALHLLQDFMSHQLQFNYQKKVPYEREMIPVDKEGGFGYQYEVRHVNECLKKGLIESPVMTHADTLTLMEVLDTIRIKAGIKYPADL